MSTITGDIASFLGRNLDGSGKYNGKGLKDNIKDTVNFAGRNVTNKGTTQ